MSFPLSEADPGPGSIPYVDYDPLDYEEVVGATAVILRRRADGQIFADLTIPTNKHGGYWSSGPVKLDWVNIAMAWAHTAPAQTPHGDASAP